MDELSVVKRIKGQFLEEWSQLDSASTEQVTKGKPRVLVLGATSEPWLLDDAMLRRFGRKHYVPLPEEATRIQQMRRLLKMESHSLTEEQFGQLGALTEGKFHLTWVNYRIFGVRYQESSSRSRNATVERVWRGASER